MSSDSPQKHPLEKEFQLDRTRDGSVSLKHAGGEIMHSRDGALSETDYIYYPVVRSLLDQADQLNCCILGLGLGYIEFGIIAEWIKAQKKMPLRLLSYELSTTLKESLRQWAEASESSQSAIQEGHKSLYVEQFDEAARLVAEKINVSFVDLKDSARMLLHSNDWILADAVTPETLKEAISHQFNGIFYDAFSGKTDGYLWSEEFLVEFLEKHSAPACLFATYAAVGTLNRALRCTSFSKIDRKGFSYKRESTWAARGNIVFKSQE